MKSSLAALYYPFSRCFQPNSLKQMLLVFDEMVWNKRLHSVIIARSRPVCTRTAQRTLCGAQIAATSSPNLAVVSKAHLVPQRLEFRCVRSWKPRP